METRANTLLADELRGLKSEAQTIVSTALAASGTEAEEKP